MPVSKGRKKPTVNRTPRKEAEHAESPAWYVWTMFGLMALGVVLVIVYYFFALDRLFLLGGLVGIAAGFMMTTNYH
ncbi:MAG: cell division protein CrgA [Acidimicrobiia bacterium]|nr:cell division protein CrgA [Acidimicrobiia bacterium]